MKDEMKSKEELFRELIKLREQVSELKETETMFKRVEEERQEIEKLSTVVKYSTELVNLADLDGRMTFLNEAGCKMLGIEPENVTSTNIMEVIPGHLKGLVESELLPALMNSDIWEGDLQYLNLKTGKLTDVHAMTFTVKDPSTKEPIFLANVSIDITERKRAEDALRESEEKYHLLVENTPSVLWKTNEKGITVFISSNIKEVYGYTAEEIYADGYISWLGRIHHDDLQKVEENFHALFERGKKFDIEYRIKRKDGEWIWLHDVASDVREENGERYTYGVFTDITERKEVERVQNATYQISESAFLADNLEVFYQSIHKIVGELMPVKNFYIALHDSDTDMLSFPYFVDEEEGTPEPYKAGKGRTEYVLHSGQPLLASPKVFEELMKRGEVESVGPPPLDWLGVPLKIKNKTVGVLVVQSYTEGLRYGEEEKNILMFVSTQIAMAIDRKKAEDQIQKDLKEKGILLKEIHHRVKNNLQVISSLLNLQSRQIKDKQVLDMFEESRKRVRSMALVHEELYRSGDFTNVNFNEYIEGLIDQIKKTYTIEPDRIEFRVEVRDVTLGIDLAIPCGLLINELISNALKHAFPLSFERKCKIEVALSSIEAGGFELIVKDNGLGIPKDIDPTKTESLGMQLIYILAEDQLGGTVNLDRDEGTKFTITFK